MSNSTTRARWSLTGAATTLALRGRITGRVVAQDVVELLSRGGIGPGPAPAGLGPAPPGGQQQYRRGQVQVAHQQPRRRPGPGEPLQLPELADVVALAVGQVAGGHRDRARAHLDGTQQRGALLAPSGRGEPHVLDPGQGQPGDQQVAVGRPARVGAGQWPEVVPNQGWRLGPEPVGAQGLGDHGWLVGAAAAGQVPVDLLHGQQVDPRARTPTTTASRSTWLVCSRRAPAIFQVPTCRLGIAAASQSACRLASAKLGARPRSRAQLAVGGNPGSAHAPTVSDPAASHHGCSSVS
jgi:hypothetical protein